MTPTPPGQGSKVKGQTGLGKVRKERKRFHWPTPTNLASARNCQWGWVPFRCLGRVREALEVRKIGQNRLFTCCGEK